MSQAERTALVVDDSPEDCAAVRRHLGRVVDGVAYRVDERHTAAAGLAACRAAPPDCLLLDYDLPDGEGLAVLTALAPDGVPPCAVVILTGRGNEGVAVRALKLGAHDYLVKGLYTPDELRRAVADAVEKAALLGELARHRAEVERLGAEARRRADDLAERDVRKDEFLAMLAHELRNPLAPIRTGLALLRSGHLDAAEADLTVAMMDRQVAHMVRLVDDLLDVSRIARGKVDLRRRAIDLADVVGQAVEAVRPRLAERGHRFTATLPPGPVPLIADPDRLAQVVGNLLTNAAKYTPPGGEVRLSAGVEGGSAVVRVRDDGIGIRPDQLGRMFDLFAQGDRVDGQVADGLGVGLALVRGLVEMHGGTVAAHSAGPGAGSEFVVRLPLADQAAAVDSAGGAGDPTEPARPLRVLIVDDNVDGAESLAAFLAHGGGHDVRVAHDGPAGLAAAQAFRPDAVLLDIGLPKGMDGYDVAARLRADGLADGATLFALTGYGQDRDRMRSAEAGFAAHLVKPVDPRLLSDLLAKLPPLPATG